MIGVEFTEFQYNQVLSGHKTQFRILASEALFMHDSKLYLIEPFRIFKRYNQALPNTYTIQYKYGGEVTRSFHVPQIVEAVGRMIKANGEAWFQDNGIPDWLHRVHIQITNSYEQPLHEITEEECLSEGVAKFTWECYPYDTFFVRPSMTSILYPTAREAFKAQCIDKFNSTFWDENPMMKVYDFKLIKEGERGK